MKSPCCSIGFYVGRLPAPASVNRRRSNQRKGKTIGIFKGKVLLAEPGAGSCDFDIVFFKTILPESEAVYRNRVTDLGSHTGSGPSLRNPFPRKECKNAARCAGFIAEVKMISARIVEVDRLLDESQPQHICVKIVGAFSVSCNSCYVVKS